MKRVVDTLWLGLLAATLAAWWLAEHQGAAVWIGPLIILIAAAKARAVVLHFMELGAAPLVWRLFFEAWVLLSAGTVAGPYWFSQNPA
jgi:hypothetical protein